MPLFSSYILELSPPCGLHLILAHHRYIWNFVAKIAAAKKKEAQLAEGLRKIGCTYMAYQLDRYYAR